MFLSRALDGYPIPYEKVNCFRSGKGAWETSLTIITLRHILGLSFVGCSPPQRGHDLQVVQALAFVDVFPSWVWPIMTFEDFALENEIYLGEAGKVGLGFEYDLSRGAAGKWTVWPF